MKLYVSRYFLPLKIYIIVDIVSLQAIIALEEDTKSLTENPKVNEIETDTLTTISMIIDSSAQKSLLQNGTPSEQDEQGMKNESPESKPSENTTESKVEEFVTNITTREQNEFSESTENSTVKNIQSDEDTTEHNIKEDVLTENSTTDLTTANNQKTVTLDLLKNVTTESPVNYRDIFIDKNIDFHNRTATDSGNFTYTEKSTNITNTAGDNSNIKYILQWSEGYHKPFEINMNAGRNIFMDRNCSFTNCVITEKRYLLQDYTDFDAVVFFAKDLISFRGYFTNFNLPTRRSPHQKYVIASLDYGQRYPASSNNILNEFFNWTWTYRLDSDMTWTYFVVKDLKGNIVAPSKDVQWIKKEEMLPVSDKIRNILIRKRKAVAWFDSCTPASKVNHYVSTLSTRLKSKYGIAVHRFGKCWRKKCRVDENDKVCNEILRKDFHFYLAFEDQISKDFVTNNVLRAYNNTVVPIVLGGANYSRFLPEGSYVDATKLTTGALVTRIYRLLLNFEEYAEHFKWTNHYTFHMTQDDPQTDPICKVCEMMNDKERLQEKTVLSNFTDWWGVVKYKMKKPILVELRDEVTTTPLEPHHESQFVKFIKKTATVLTSIVNDVVSDVKYFWNVLTGSNSSPSDTCHHDEDH